MSDDFFSDEIQEKTIALRDAILNSEEYVKYLTCKKVLEKEQDLYERVNQFRARNFELQITGKSQDYDQVTNLMKNYEDVLSDSNVSAFMNAELMLCRRLHQMNEELMEEIDLDLRFL